MTLGEAPATLLHIGCGYAAEWRKTGFPAQYARIVLVEPNPACSEDLQDLAKADPRVQVISAAVAVKDGQADFFLMSFEDLSGLRPVRKLTAMMPGLIEERKMPVRCLSIATLLTEAGLTEAGLAEPGLTEAGQAEPVDAPETEDSGADDSAAAGGRDMLILEAMGMESAVLRALAPLGVLSRFARIRVQMPRVPLQSSDFDHDTAAAFLAAEGFVIQDAAADADPDWPQLMFRRDATLTTALAQAEALETVLHQTRIQVGSAQQAAEDEKRHLIAEVAALEGRAKAAEDKAATEAQKAREAQEAAKAEAARLTGLLSEKESGLVAGRVAQDSLTARIREMAAQIKAAEETAEKTLVATHEKLAAAEQETQKFRKFHEAAKAEGARQSAIVRDRNSALAAAQGSEAALVARVIELETRLVAEAAEARKLRDGHEALRAETARQTVISQEKDAAISAAKAAQFSTNRQLVEVETRATAAEDALATLETRARALEDMALAESVRLSARIIETETALAEAALELDTARAAAAQTEAALEERATAAEARCHLLETEATTAHEAALAETARLAALISAKDLALHEAVARLQAAAADSTALQARIAETEARAAEEATTLTAELQALRAAQDAALAESARLAALVSARAAALADLQGAQARLETHLADTQGDLRLAMRMQAVAGGNLQDLQTRYAEVLARKDSQDQLIAQLILRLEEASEHLQTLTLTGQLADKRSESRPRTAADTSAPLSPTPASPTPASRSRKTRAGTSKATPS